MTNQKQLEALDKLEFPMFRTAFKEAKNLEELFRMDMLVLDGLMDEEWETYKECWEKVHGRTW